MKDIKLLRHLIDGPIVVKKKNGPKFNRATGLGLSVLLPSVRDPEMLLLAGGGIRADMTGVSRALLWDRL